MIRTAVVGGRPALAVRYGCSVASARMSYLSSKMVKRTLRDVQKLLRLGASYKEAGQYEVVAVEGVDQLETYFAVSCSQFFYATPAPHPVGGAGVHQLPSAAVLPAARGRSTR